MAPLRVSILGTGLSLQAFHNPLIVALPDQFVVHSVFERSNRGKAKEVCGDSIKVVTTIDEVLNDKDVDVVSTQRSKQNIATKADLHFRSSCRPPTTPTTPMPRLPLRPASMVSLSHPAYGD